MQTQSDKLQELIAKMDSISEKDTPYGGENASMVYLKSIDDYVKQLATAKDRNEVESLAYQIQNAADDLRKHLRQEPTNVRGMFNKEDKDEK